MISGIPLKKKPNTRTLSGVFFDQVRWSTTLRFNSTVSVKDVMAARWMLSTTSSENSVWVNSYFFWRCRVFWLLLGIQSCLQNIFNFIWLSFFPGFGRKEKGFRFRLLVFTFLVPWKKERDGVNQIPHLVVCRPNDHSISSLLPFFFDADFPYSCHHSGNLFIQATTIPSNFELGRVEIQWNSVKFSEFSMNLTLALTDSNLEG